MKIISASPAFLDTEIALRSMYKNVPDDTVCLLGGWILSKSHTIAEYKRQFSKVIVFNQEQIANKTRQFMSIEYFSWFKDADEVWDYDEYNIECLRSIRNDIKLTLLQPCNELNAGSALRKDIDVLFYGTMNPHREHIINELRKHKINIVTPRYVWGSALNPYIARSKLCLNIHYYYETALQEQARMIRWVSSGANIISETSRTNYMNIREVEYNQLISTILSLI